MGEWIVAIAGTPAGERLALALALLSALSHATFGAINKGGQDPHLNRGAINICYSAMAAPFALFVFPLPSPHALGDPRGRLRHSFRLRISPIAGV